MPRRVSRKRNRKRIIRSKSRILKKFRNRRSRRSARPRSKSRRAMKGGGGCERPHPKENRDCGTATVDGSKFCIKHKCPTDGCTNSKSGKKMTCDSHMNIDDVETQLKCRIEGCPRDVLNGENGMCTYHEAHQVEEGDEEWYMDISAKAKAKRSISEEESLKTEIARINSKLWYNDAINSEAKAIVAVSKLCDDTNFLVWENDTGHLVLSYKKPQEDLYRNVAAPEATYDDIGVDHKSINLDKNQFYIHEQDKFKNITELLEYYKKKPIVTNHVLVGDGCRATQLTSTPTSASEDYIESGNADAIYASPDNRLICDADVQGRLGSNALDRLLQWMCTIPSKDWGKILGAGREPLNARFLTDMKTKFDAGNDITKLEEFKNEFDRKKDRVGIGGFVMGIFKRLFKETIDFTYELDDDANEKAEANKDKVNEVFAKIKGIPNITNILRILHDIYYYDYKPACNNDPGCTVDGENPALKMFARANVMLIKTNLQLDILEDIEINITKLSFLIKNANALITLLEKQ